MNRLFLALVLGATLFCGNATAQADRQALSGFCEEGGKTVSVVGITSTTKVQRSYPGCTITVYDSGTANLSTIYADQAGTPKANPFTADATTGYWFFYGDPGRFDVQLSGAGMSTVTRGGLWIVAGGGGGGGGVSGSGTLNTIPKWTPDTTTLGNSIITEVGGSQIEVGGTFYVQNTASIGALPSSTIGQYISKTFSTAGAGPYGQLSTISLSNLSAPAESWSGAFLSTTSGTTTANSTSIGALRAFFNHTGTGVIVAPNAISATVAQSGSGSVTSPVAVLGAVELLTSTSEATVFKATGDMDAGTHTVYNDFWSLTPTLNGSAAITTYYGFRADGGLSRASITNYYPFSSSEGIVSFEKGIGYDDRLQLRSSMPIRFYDSGNVGYTQIKQDTQPASNYTLFLPTDAPAVGDVLTVNGITVADVTLAWSQPGVIGSGTTNRLPLWSASTTLGDSLLGQVSTDEIYMAGGSRFNIATAATTFEIANEGGTGTTVNKLAKLTGAPATATIATTGDTTGLIGVVVSGAGTTGNAKIAYTGTAPCVFDGATTAGNYVGASTSNNGECTDLGSSTPTSGAQVIGRVLSTNASAGTYNILITGLDAAGASSGASGTINSGVQYKLAYYPSNGTTVDDLSTVSTDSSNRLIFSTATAQAPVTLTDAATIATDASLGNRFTVTLGGNRTLGAPTNPLDGQQLVYEFCQDGAGGRTLSLDTGAGGFALGTDLPIVTLTTTADKCDYMTVIYNSTANKWRVVGFVKGF